MEAAKYDQVPRLVALNVPAPVAGLYFLFLRGALVYVGQGVDLRMRISQHRRARDAKKSAERKNFDAHLVIEIAARPGKPLSEELNAAEAAAILTLRPRSNGNRGRGSDGAAVSWWRSHLASALASVRTAVPSRETDAGIRPGRAL